MSDSINMTGSIRKLYDYYQGLLIDEGEDRSLQKKYHDFTIESVISYNNHIQRLTMQMPPIWRYRGARYWLHDYQDYLNLLSCMTPEEQVLILPILSRIYPHIVDKYIYSIPLLYRFSAYLFSPMTIKIDYIDELIQDVIKISASSDRKNDLADICIRCAIESADLLSEEAAESVWIHLVRDSEDAVIFLNKRARIKRDFLLKKAHDFMAENKVVDAIFLELIGGYETSFLNENMPRIMNMRLSPDFLIQNYNIIKPIIERKISGEYDDDFLFNQIDGHVRDWLRKAGVVTKNKIEHDYTKGGLTQDIYLVKENGIDEKGLIEYISNDIERLDEVSEEMYRHGYLHDCPEELIIENIDKLKNIYYLIGSAISVGRDFIERYEHIVERHLMRMPIDDMAEEVARILQGGYMPYSHINQGRMSYKTTRWAEIKPSTKVKLFISKPVSIETRRLCYRIISEELMKSGIIFDDILYSSIYQYNQDKREP